MASQFDDPAGDAPPARRLRHGALLYPDLDTYRSEVTGFVNGGLAAGEPVLVAAPEDRLSLLREALGAAAGDVEFVDMTERGRNPNLLIPTILRAFLDRHGPSRTRITVETIWPGRLPEEIESAVRAEALVNRVLRGYPTTLLCPYDAALLSPSVLRLANRTHPNVVDHGRPLPCGDYVDPGVVLAVLNDPLPDYSPATVEINFDRDSLAEAVALIASYGTDAGLSPQRLDDLLRALTEVARTTLGPDDGPGTLRLLDQADGLVCEIRTPGREADFLAGQLVPADDSARGRGLYTANRLCDLVETHTHVNSSTTRLFMWR